MLTETEIASHFFMKLLKKMDKQDLFSSSQYLVFRLHLLRYLMARMKQNRLCSMTVGFTKVVNNSPLLFKAAEKAKMDCNQFHDLLKKVPPVTLYLCPGKVQACFYSVKKETLFKESENDRKRSVQIWPPGFFLFLFCVVWCVMLHKSNINKCSYTLGWW